MAIPCITVLCGDHQAALFFTIINCDMINTLVHKLVSLNIFLPC